MRIIVAYGLAGYGPDASNENYHVCETWPQVADALRMRLEESGESALQEAEIMAAQGDYEAAWNRRKEADAMWHLSASLDNKRQDAPLYRGDPEAWAATIERIVGDNFPYDVSGSDRLYAWPDEEFAADEEA